MQTKPLCLLTALCVSLCCMAGSCFGGQLQSPGISSAEIQRILQSTNGEVRFHLAQKLTAEHTEETFKALLRLLQDDNVDISYAAAESIEARKDKQFADLFITAIRGLPRDKRWPAYRAAKNYGTPRMLKFLEEALKEEIAFRRKKRTFDSENCFYISHNIEQVLRAVDQSSKIPAPNGTSLPEYERFMKALISHEKGLNSTSNHSARDAK